MLTQLRRHRTELLACRRCPNMIPPVVSGRAVDTRIYFVGQAPGPREGEIGQPFAWTAGKRLFEWFKSIGVDEETFRSRAYIAAVARCFPGKAKSGGGDRVPSPTEVKECSAWMRREVEIIKPSLVIAVGRLAIEQVLGRKLARLDDVVGPLHRSHFFDREVDWVALPHPSGLSAWHKVEPGRTKLNGALKTLAHHATWRETFA